MIERPDCDGDAAAYVLGALEPTEAESFERHMNGCVACRDEVASLQPVVDALPLAAPQRSMPGGLRRRLLKQVRFEASAARAHSQRVRLPAGFGMRRPALVGGLLAAVALATGGGVELDSSGSSGTRTFVSSVGSADLRVSGGHGELVVQHLPPPPNGRIYEVWLKRSHQVPAPTKALFSVTAAGAGDVDVPGDLDGVSEVLVTQEPAGGSLVPTTSPVIVARLS